MISFPKGVAAFVALGLLAASPAITSAQVTAVGANAFGGSDPVITFDDTPQVPLGSQDPSYTFNSPDGSEITASFGGTFIGQVASDQNTSPVTLTTDQPTGPLTLDPNGSTVFTTDDPASSTSPVLSGTPLFEAPISILFDHPVSKVGLTGGSFAAPDSVLMQAYGANGTILGSTTNSLSGFQFLGLADTTGANSISGISIFITASSPDVSASSTSGFEIDNVTIFPIPLPSALNMGLMGLTGIISFSAVRRRLSRDI
jgi:hypothetical protein